MTLLGLTLDKINWRNWEEERRKRCIFFFIKTAHEVHFQQSDVPETTTNIATTTAPILSDSLEAMVHLELEKLKK